MYRFSTWKYSGAFEIASKVTQECVHWKPSYIGGLHICVNAGSGLDLSRNCFRRLMQCLLKHCVLFGVLGHELDKA